MGVDARYHQITYYAGEADTTPSFFVAKVRGRETHWGDYYVEYTAHLSSKCNSNPHSLDNPTGMPFTLALIETHPEIDRLDWSTYSGMGSNGFEEIIFAFVATLGEVGIALTLWFLLRRRRRAA